MMEVRGASHDVFKHDLKEYGQILSVELSPYPTSQDVLLIGFSNKVLLFRLKIEDTVEFEGEPVVFVHNSRCMSLSISPETMLSSLPQCVVFATGGFDHRVRVYKSDLKGEDDVCRVMLSGHDDHVNDVKYDPDGNYLVSVGDDNTARLWEVDEYKSVGTLQLTSPGMSCCWHRDDSSKLLVAEKCGLVRFYNVDTQCPILSLDYGRPLSGAHWAPSDSQLITSLQMGELLIWDLTKPCVPVSSTLIFTEAGGCAKFSPFRELVACVNSLECSLKVVHVHNQQLKLSMPVTLPSNISWHTRAPIVCVGDYTTLCFYRVPVK